MLYPKPGVGGGKVENDDTEFLNLEYKMSPSGNKRQEPAQDQQSQGGPEKAHCTGQGSPQEMLWGGLNADTESWSVRRKRKGNEKPY